MAANYPEKFVVFKYVNRLLEKNYKPKRIECPLGRTQKSGKADIAVMDLQGNVLLLVYAKLGNLSSI